MKPKTKPRIGKERRQRLQQRTTDIDIKIGTWNVRSLLRPGALRTVTDALQRAGITITALQETRYPGKDVIKGRDYSFYYSGKSVEKNREFGTGFVVLKAATGAVIDFNPINERLCTLRIRGKFFNISLINAHAPTEEKDDEVKELFYERLQLAYNNAPPRDIKIILGDFNAKVGQEETYRPAIGLHSLHELSNDNGVRLIDFAILNNLVVTSTYFPHKSIHKVTWRSPDGRTANQIDHVMIDGRHRWNILDVKSCRGPNIDSDHYLVRVLFRARIDARNNQRPAPRRFNVEKLNSANTRKLYAEKMEQRILEDVTEVPADDDVEELWNRIRTSVETVAEEVVGRKGPRKRNDWFDEECKQALDAKNAARAKHLQRATRANLEDYRAKRTLERRLFRRKKAQQEQVLIATVEHLSGEKDIRGLYRTVKEVKSGNNNNLPLLCKDRNGAVLADEQKCIARWTEYFKQLLNSEAASPTCHQTRSRTSHQQQQQQQPQPFVAEPSIQEVELVVAKIKNNKSPGSDNLPGELLKYGGAALLSVLHDLITMIWRKEQLPSEWKIGIICPLYKKGDKLECANYRGITLLNTAYKVFANILHQRLQTYAEEIIGEYQAGFRGDRATTDQIFAIRQILEKCREFNITTHHLFVDFKAAYDSITRSALWRVMEQFGIPRKLIDLAKMTMSSISSRVRIRNQLSEAFTIEQGLRQGDPLATLLFNIALEKAVRDSGVDTSNSIYRKSSMLLAYADDIDVVGRNAKQVKNTFAALQVGAAEVGLSVNVSKTKYMVAQASVADTFPTSTTIRLGDENFEVVDSFVYLGSLVNQDNSVQKEVRRRITLGNRCFYGLHKLFRAKTLSRSLKCTLYRTLVRPVVTYGSETWSTTKRDEQNLMTFEHRILRSIFGAVYEPTGWRRRMNHELDTLFGQPNIVRTIKIGRMRWLGHVHRMDEHRIPRKLFEGAPDGTRRQGRPRNRWKDGVLADLQTLHVRDWRTLAGNRPGWRSLLKEARSDTRL